MSAASITQISWQTPLLKWRPGWRLAASPWQTIPATGQGTALLTLETPGEFTPDLTPVPWSLHLGAPAGVEREASNLLACGFHLSVGRAADSAAISGLMVGRGAVLGESVAEINPCLFSAVHEVFHKDGTWSVRATDHQAVLLVQKQAGITRFCLVYGKEELHALMANARGYLEQDLTALMNQEWARRASFWNNHDVAESHRPLVAFTLETMFSRLRPAEGSLPHLWMATPGLNPDAFNTRELLPLVTAWSSIVPAVAMDLVKCVLGSQEPDGFIPSVIEPYMPETSPHAPTLPLVAQAAQRAVQSANAASDVIAYIYPRLLLYLEWTLNHYELNQPNIPCWRGADEALIPETYDLNLASADLTTFLLCEIEAFLALPRLESVRADTVANLQRIRDHLAHTLMFDLWDSSSRCFTDRYADGPHIKRITLSAVIPFLWSGLAPDVAMELRRLLTSPAHFRSPHGILLWLKWENDPVPPPMPSLCQALLVDAFLQSYDRTQWEPLYKDLLRSISSAWKVSGRLPADWTASDTAPEDSLATASLVIRLMAADRGVGAPRISIVATWLDRHRVAAVLLIALLGFIVVALIAAMTIGRKTLTEQTVETMKGMARRQYDIGKYEEAMKIYEDIKKGSRYRADVELSIGNTHYRLGNYAAATGVYHDIIRRQPSNVPAMMNLGLTLFHMKKFDEAERAYKDVVERFAQSHPPLAERARVALLLIEEQRRYAKHANQPPQKL